MAGQRVVIFCLVPAELEDQLFAPLRRHYAKDRRVRVIVDRRGPDRRSDPAARPVDRRSGTDRRRPVLERTIARFPRRLKQHRDSVRFVQRLIPVSSGLETLPTADVVDRVRRGDPAAPTELFWRCHQRIHSRLAVLLGDPAEAEAEAAAAFGRVLDAIEASKGRVTDFDDLLYSAVDAAFSERRPLPEVAAARAAEDLLSLAITDPLLDEPVLVTDRDPRWFGRARHERDLLLRAAGDHIVGVEHIGGTAVPATAGRPIVDLLVGVESLPVPPRLHAALVRRGYEDCGDAGNPARAYYRRRGLARFDVHVVEHGSALWHEPIRLREYLRFHNPDAHRWAHARREAARRAAYSLLAYAEARADALAALRVRVGEENAERAV